VNCPNTGGTESPLRMDLAAHDATCGHRAVACGHCKELMERRLLARHEEHCGSPFGWIELVKKDGTKGQQFPLAKRRYLFGRSGHRDILICINLLNVSREHAEIVVDEKNQVSSVSFL